MAAAESNGDTPTVPGFGTEARSQVLVDTPYFAKDVRRVRGRMWEGNTCKPRTSKGFLNPAFAVGTTIKGSIEAKIDSGYLISVIVGGENFKGVLYNVSPIREVNQFRRVVASPVELQAADIKSKSIKNTKSGCLRRRRRKFLTKDRNAPKKNRTGFNFFFAEERLRLKEAYPKMRAAREISRTIAEAWNRLSQKARKSYEELGVKDKERYRKEMRQYVYLRLRKLKPLNEDTKAYGSAC